MNVNDSNTKSDPKSAPPDHEQIYLEPPCCADPSEGRQWCQDDVSDCKDGREATRYVRADLAEADRAAQAKRIEELESQLAEEERDHLRTIDERDQFEKRIVEIGWSIGLLESDLEWSNLNDVGERCVQRAEELLSQIDSACVVINAFKSFQMLMDGKIDEPTFNSIIQGAEKDMARAAEWLNEYVNAAVEQLASTEKYNEALRGELDQSRTERDAAIQRAEAAEALCKGLSEQLEFDRTAVADGITKANKAIDSRHWLTEGRGSYEWDDDRWHEEFYAAAIEIRNALSPLSMIAANWTGCPQSGPDVVKARIDLKAQLAAIQAALPAERALEIAEGLEWNEPDNSGAISSAKELCAYAAALGKEG